MMAVLILKIHCFRSYPHDEAAEIALNTVDKCSKGLEEVQMVSLPSSLSQYAFNVIYSS